MFRFVCMEQMMDRYIWKCSDRRRNRLGMINIFLREYRNEFQEGNLYIVCRSRLEHLMGIVGNYPLWSYSKCLRGRFDRFWCLCSNNLGMRMQYKLHLNNMVYLEDICISKCWHQRLILQGMKGIVCCLHHNGFLGSNLYRSFRSKQVGFQGK